VRNGITAALILAGVGLFSFYLFSVSFSAQQGDPVGWHAEAGYEVRARIGIAAGAVLVAAGWLVRKIRP